MPVRGGEMRWIALLLLVLLAVECNPVPVIVGETLTVEGTIVDAETGQPVRGQVFINGREVLRNVTTFRVTAPGPSVTVTVQAPGYVTWSVNFAARGSKVFSGPVRLKKR
jgi:hypothetical protein